MEVSSTTIQNWPQCRSRSTFSSDDATAQCNHSQVRIRGNLVTPQLCEICSMRDTPSPSVVNLRQESQALSLRTLGWNVAVAVSSFVVDGAKTVTQSQYAARLEVCASCDRRTGNRCRECGCQLRLKARGRVFRCPLGKWDEV